MQFNHFRYLLNTTYFYPLFDKLNYLNHEKINYKDFDVSEYKNTDQSSYWLAKATLKAINHSLNINGPKFIFVDYKLNHLPISYDSFGNKLDISEQYNLSFYRGNYIYSSKLLIEMLNFIQNNDKAAVIIVQADHGMHMLEDDDVMNQLSINKEQLLEIRNSVISAYYIPDKYQNGDEKYLYNPLNFSRYLVNNYVGNNYKYIK